MDVVQDVKRPDVGGVPPKMKAVGELVEGALRPRTQRGDAGKLGYLNIQTNDNLGSSVCVRLTREVPGAWSNGIFHNARYVIAFFRPQGGKRYYGAGEGVTVEVSSSGQGVPKFRKYTSTPEKAVAKFNEWLDTWA